MGSGGIGTASPEPVEPFSIGTAVPPQPQEDWQPQLLLQWLLQQPQPNRSCSGRKQRLLQQLLAQPQDVEAWHPQDGASAAWQPHEVEAPQPQLDLQHFDLQQQFESNRPRKPSNGLQQRWRQQLLAQPQLEAAWQPHEGAAAWQLHDGAAASQALGQHFGLQQRCLQQGLAQQDD